MRKEYIIYGFISLFLAILAFISVDYSGSILQILMHIITGLILTQWYICLGLISPWILRKALESNGLNDDDPRHEFHNGILSKPQVGIIMVIFTFWILLTSYVLDSNITAFDQLVVAFYILGPSVFLIRRGWFTLFVSVLWVWFPIEWGLAEDHLGSLHFEILPADALIGLVALLLPLIAYGRHVPWYHWKLSKLDLKWFNYGSIAITLAVVPLGILLKFLRISLDNLRAEDSFTDALGMVILVFLAIFVVQGLMEETLFRGIIFKHWYYELQLKEQHEKFKTYSYASIISTGILIASIPFWGAVLGVLAKIPFWFFTDMEARVGDLHRPLGEYEGAPLFSDLPVWPFYLLVGIILTIIGILLFHKYPTALVPALMASAMIFGFAHFQDWRYVFFATLAGMGYGMTYFKTKNIAAAAMVHMGVDAVWAIFLSY
ncbi:MAG: CPBP family intramembrane metalloprotease [Candidatus Heimdallarchaeota archaeon]|nr:CPBP family intramembrane metalloprotease [Candidatus Heimdallarchaeota archaeon]